jgi:hypothetical protein
MFHFELFLQNFPKQNFFGPTEFYSFVEHPAARFSMGQLNCAVMVIVSLCYIFKVLLGKLC